MSLCQTQLTKQNHDIQAKEAKYAAAVAAETRESENNIQLV